MRGKHSPEEQRHRQNCRYFVACPYCKAAAGDKCVGTTGKPRAACHVERWQLFDPAHVAAKALRQEKTMTRFNTDNDTEYDRDADRLCDEYPESGVTCLRCGQSGLHWRMVTQADGRSEKPVLFDDSMHRHVCKPAPDDFEVIA